jgi:periplasmic protein TonB
MTVLAEDRFVSVLPWSSSDRENRTFSRISQAMLLLTVVFALIVRWQQLPEVPRAEKEKLPAQLTRILTPRKVEAPKPLPEPMVIPDKKEEIKQPEKPQPPKEVEKKPVEVKKPADKPKLKLPTKAELAKKAQEKAKQSGLLALQDELASMRSEVNINNLANTQQIKGAGQAEQTQRAFIGKKVAGSSGGVDTSKLSSDIGSKGQLVGRKTTEYVAPNEGLASLAAQQLVTEDEVVGNRDLESIRKVLDTNKAVIYAIYRRALRQDPSLQGKVTVNLVIEPDGSVSAAKLVSSELKMPELEDKLLARIALINFGSQNAVRTVLDYSFNFLPF